MDVLVLLSILAVGAALGYALRSNARALAMDRAAARYAIFSLLFVMGAKLARGSEHFAHDLSRLVWAAASALLLVLVFAGVFLVFRAVRGPGGAQSAEQESAGTAGHELGAMAANAFWIALGFALALLLPARLFEAVPAESAAGWILRFLLLAIGFDLGAELPKLRLRDLPPALLLTPFFNIALSLVCGALYSRVQGVPLRQGLLLYAGLGWYSLSSVLIAQQGLGLLSLLAFVHNVTRELLAILTAPLAARISPYLPIYLGGATAMDVTLPFVQRYSGRGYTLVSFYSGVVCSFAVMPLVRALLPG